ncbi:hypothetical protein QBC39DRAFT_260043 [Podospora conica]|nr:hypothetical protein QBC39DRAFT_260043 [Schizothecium conicum]
MVSQAAYYSTSASDGGRRYNHHRPSYPPYLEFQGHERRFHPSPSHDARPATMTDQQQQQMDNESAPQRKRIAVACGRCRKRKIRCSGDLGNGEACVNCKNAGTDQCLFLRVQSREAPLIDEPTGFHGYAMTDARALSTRGAPSPAPPAHGMGSYASSDVPMTGTSISYPDSPAPTKAYYPVSSYSPHYSDEFDQYSTGQPMLHDPVTGMMPNQWARKPYGGMYLEPASYATTSYGSGAPLVHRPAPSAEPSSSLSLSGFGAELPSTTTPQSADRLLPNPAIRTPYPAIKSPAPHATLADIATAASYVSSFDTGMSYSSSSHRSGSSSGHEPDGLFSDHERSIQSQGPGLDFGGYTSDPLATSSGAGRRDSLVSTSGSGGGGGGGTLANGQTYVPSEPMYTPAPHPHYGHHSHHGYGTTHHQHHRGGVVGGGSAGRQTDGHRMASVASRR